MNLTYEQRQLIIQDIQSRLFEKTGETFYIDIDTDAMTIGVMNPVNKIMFDTTCYILSPDNTDDISSFVNTAVVKYKRYLEIYNKGVQKILDDIYKEHSLLEQVSQKITSKMVETRKFVKKDKYKTQYIVSGEFWNDKGLAYRASKGLEDEHVVSYLVDKYINS